MNLPSQQLRNIPDTTGELSALLRDIGLAAKRVNVEVNKAGLVDILGDLVLPMCREKVKNWMFFANEQFYGRVAAWRKLRRHRQRRKWILCSVYDVINRESKHYCSFDPWMAARILM